MWLSFVVIFSSACFSFVSSDVALPKCGTDARVDWFHLQEASGDWTEHSQSLVAEWESIAEKVRRALPESKFGAALFGGIGRQYHLLSDLKKNLNSTEIRQALEYAAERWADLRAESANSTTKSLKSISPLIWASLHSNWDHEPKTYRFVTMAQVSQPEVDEEGKAHGNLKSFEERVLPSSERGIWPNDFQPQLHKGRAEPSLELVKDVLQRTNVHLIVNAGEGPATEAWSKVLAAIGQRPPFGIPGNLQSLDHHQMALNVIAAMEEIMGCSLQAPLRRLQQADLPAEADCVNVCECHSDECRPCCKKGDNVLIDIPDKPSHLNISMGSPN